MPWAGVVVQVWSWWACLWLQTAWVGTRRGSVEDLAPMAEAVALALQGLTFRQQLAEASRLALILLKVWGYTHGKRVLYPSRTW